MIAKTITIVLLAVMAIAFFLPEDYKLFKHKPGPTKRIEIGENLTFIIIFIILIIAISFMIWHTNHAMC